MNLAILQEVHVCEGAGRYLIDEQAGSIGLTTVLGTGFSSKSNTIVKNSQAEPSHFTLTCLIDTLDVQIDVESASMQTIVSFAIHGINKLGQTRRQIQAQVIYILQLACIRCLCILCA